jgi:hypothetical protein
MHQEMDSGAAVPAFRILRVKRHYLIQKVERDIPFLFVHRLAGPTHHQVDGGTAGPIPFGPDTVGNAFCACLAVLALQLTEQIVQALLAGLFGFDRG